jgi:Cdc6-like AAA superfamily ATPase
MPLQSQLVLTSIYLLTKYDKTHVITSGDVYEVHTELTNKISGVKQLTHRRISDYINELALAGLINANTKSMGHYGRTKLISLDIDIELVERVLSQIKRITDNNLIKFRPILLQTDKVKIKNNVFRKLL